MGNTISDAQKNTTQNFVQQNKTDNNNVSKSPHNFPNVAGMNPPPECPMHVKTEEKKPVAGCAVAGSADDINPLNMVGIYKILR